MAGPNTAWTWPHTVCVLLPAHHLHEVRKVKALPAILVVQRDRDGGPLPGHGQVRRRGAISPPRSPRIDSNLQQLRTRATVAGAAVTAHTLAAQTAICSSFTPVTPVQAKLSHAQLDGNKGTFPLPPTSVTRVLPSARVSASA